MVDPNPASEANGVRDTMASVVKQLARQARRLTVRLTAIVVVLVVSVGLFEGLARMVFAWQEEIRRIPIISEMLQRSLDLDPYEMPSPKGGYHWVLRPAYEATSRQLVEEKSRARRTLGAQMLKAELGAPGGDARKIFRINRDGFKGPELDRSHSRPRILMLGDSTTFGIGVVDYPRAAARALAARGIAAEVINGGVEGYTPHDVLLEIDRYKALKPQIAALYIGWNALFKQAPWPDAWENRLRLVWLVTSAYRALQVRLDPVADARGLADRKPKPDPRSPRVKSLEAYDPPFMDEIERIVEGLAAAGTDVVLVTLPGLFTPSETPTPRALAIGHLPRFTDNPSVLAVLTGRYNAALRDLARRRGLDIIDLEQWSIDSLRPRDAYFLDSVHLTARGLELIGAFMAERLAPRVESLQKRKSRTGNR